MKILICKQGLFGGTDKLLSRLYDWLKNNAYSVTVYTNGVFEERCEKSGYDLAILPSSQLGDLYQITKKGICIKRLLIWIMGIGAFSDSYYNSPTIHFLDKTLKFFYKNESCSTLRWLINSDAIVFTDSGGLYNTIINLSGNENKVKNSIVPIAIKVPKTNSWSSLLESNGNKTIHISWIGRVSSDFKEIPLLHLMDDIDAFIRSKTLSVELSIVGDGNAIDHIKNKATQVHYAVRFISNIPYDRLNGYLSHSVDLLVAMGTSALDGAKVGCPTIVITPVRSCDPVRVEYRWIYESLGYSLGEYPDIDIKTGQRRCNFEKIMSEFLLDSDVSHKCFAYAQEFDMEKVFRGLLQRKLPDQIDAEMEKHIKRFYNMKTRKKIIKKILGR